jgi:hypothetical protein
MSSIKRFNIAAIYARGIRDGDFDANQPATRVAGATLNRIPQYGLT